MIVPGSAGIKGKDVANVEQLFSDYNYFRLKTSNFQRLVREKRVPCNTLDRNGPTGRKLIKALTAMDAWCLEQGVDARHWLQSLFQIRRWNFAPRVDHLISPKHLKRYRESPQPAPQYESVVRAESAAARQKAGRSYEPTRDLSNTTESRKRTYLSIGNSERCMEEMQTATLGYHPKSLVCARCPTADRCRAQLQATSPYDIVALRDGSLSLVDAQMIAARGNHGN